MLRKEPSIYSSVSSVQVVEDQVFVAVLQEAAGGRKLLFFDWTIVEVRRLSQRTCYVRRADGGIWRAHPIT